ncbi:uncharacterized protein [Lepeophtheirus salmonis]|uniref:uncharacterized protein isoform X2 n=1 Tax=Lepeophtheirus salmonis TaxID=72036 RepID=UPI001AE1CC48|nr:uncharacterized protein LOC121128507 [Lepeophtheirus salmonis]
MLVGISSAQISSRSYESRYNHDDDRTHRKVHPTDKVRKMAIEDGHTLDLEGGRRPSFRKYKQDTEDMNGHPYTTEDRVSVLSNSSFRQHGGSVTGSDAPKQPWYKGVTCHDIRAIMPTVLILLGGLLIMIFVIPYAFSTVIKQLQAEEVLEQKRLAEEAGSNNLSTLLTTLSPVSESTTPLLLASSSSSSIPSPTPSGS